MKCASCGHAGFKKEELNDYDGDGVLICGECADMRDLEDKHEGEGWDEEEDDPAVFDPDDNRLEH